MTSFNIVILTIVMQMQRENKSYFPFNHSMRSENIFMLVSDGYSIRISVFQVVNLLNQLYFFQAFLDILNLCMIAAARSIF